MQAVPSKSPLSVPVGSTKGLGRFRGRARRHDRDFVKPPHPLGYPLTLAGNTCPELVPSSCPSEERGRGECRVPDAPADGVTGIRGGPSSQAALATALFCGARRAAWLEGRRSSLT